MAFGIMRVEKRGRAAVMGLQLENNRTPEDGRHFAASDIDREQLLFSILLGLATGNFPAN